MNYTTEITSIDIERTSFVVLYTPEDVSLSPISLNVGFQIQPYQDILDDFGSQVYANQASVPFSTHIEYSKRMAAPTHIWEKQRMMLDNYALIM